MSTWLQQAALWTWQNSLAAAVLVLVVMGLRCVLRGKIAPLWLCIAGWLVLVRLWLPAPLPHAWGWDRAWVSSAAPGEEKPVVARLEETAATVAPALSMEEMREEIAAARSTLNHLSGAVLGKALPEVRDIGGEVSASELSVRPSTPAAQAVSIDWLAIALWVWIAGVLGSVIHTLIRHRRFLRRLARTARPVVLPWPGLAARCATTAGLRRAPPLFTVPGSGTPFLCGLFRPRIILPAGTLEMLTMDEARHVLLHEMLHIRRHDLAANWLLAAARALHWFNPLVHFTCRRLLADRELLRDHQAIALLRDPSERAAYGHTLLKLALPLSAPAPSPGLAPFFRSEKELKRRLIMIQSPLSHHRLAAALATVTLTALSSVLFTTARGQEKSAPATPPATPPEVSNRQDQKAVGEIVRVDAEGGFVLIRARNGIPLAISDELEGSSPGNGRFKVTREGKGEFYAADILSGKPQKGQAVIASKSNKPVPVAANALPDSRASANNVNVDPSSTPAEELPRGDPGAGAPAPAPSAAVPVPAAPTPPAASAAPAVPPTPERPATSSADVAPAVPASPAGAASVRSATPPSADSPATAENPNKVSVRASKASSARPPKAAPVQAEASVTSSGSSASQPLDNLRAVAAKLRANGQSAEADAIEEALKRFPAAALPSQTTSASEMQQLRAEMAEVRAALAGLKRHVTPMDLQDELSQLMAQLAKAGAAGFGVAHPKIAALKQSIKTIQERIDAMGKAMADQKSRDSGADAAALAKSVAEIEQSRAELLKAAAAWKEDAARAKETDAKLKLERDLVNKVDLLKKTEEMKKKAEDMNRYAEALKNHKDVRKGAAEELDARPAEAVKDTDQAGDDLPWGVAVPGKKGLVYSPYTEERSVVDVTGIAKRTKVKCPFTGNFFRVP